MIQLGILILISKNFRGPLNTDVIYKIDSLMMVSVNSSRQPGNSNKTSKTCTHNFAILISHTYMALQPGVRDVHMKTTQESMPKLPLSLIGLEIKLTQIFSLLLNLPQLSQAIIWFRKALLALKMAFLRTEKLSMEMMQLKTHGPGSLESEWVVTSVADPFYLITGL